MITRQLTLKNRSGLHARPASLWVEAASRYQCRVGIRFGDSEVDGKSILGVLSLGLGAGTTFQFTVDGVDELEAAGELETLLVNLEQQDE